MAETAQPSITPDEAANDGIEPSVGDFFALLKPRVMSLVVFTGAVGLYLAPGELHPVLAAVTILCIAIGAGASGAINMWFDADIDAVMQRTVKRPIPAGKISREAALAFGMILAFGSVALLGLGVNWIAGGLLGLTIAFYVVIYTMWLKRRTSQNIVIGGAAGAFPPIIGWAAVTGDVTLAPILLFLIIFFWTPPHFWALALFRTGDYAKAGVPMLPVVSGRDETRKQILIYSLILAPLGVAPSFIGVSGLAFGIFSAALGGYLIFGAVRLWRSDTDRDAKRLFSYSIVYLFALFAGLAVERAVGLS